MFSYLFPSWTTHSMRSKRTFRFVRFHSLHLHLKQEVPQSNFQVLSLIEATWQSYLEKKSCVWTNILVISLTHAPQNIVYHHQGGIVTHVLMCDEQTKQLVPILFQLAKKTHFLFPTFSILFVAGSVNDCSYPKNIFLIHSWGSHVDVCSESPVHAISSLHTCRGTFLPQ